ncbi:MAG: NAD(P)H-dependent glycerol-3-phosphate dehydrogenase [Casimicrobium sp.]
MKIAVLGAGAWGTALASRLAHNLDHQVRLWGRDASVVTAINDARRNPRYLPDIDLSPALAATVSLADAARDVDLVILGAPVATTETLLRELPAHSRVPVVSLSKGFIAHEEQTRLLPDVLSTFGEKQSIATGVLSGPSFAGETARGLPLALVCAMSDGAVASTLAHALRDAAMRVYASEDVVGVSLCGAVKNVFAIAAGVSDGLKLGANSRAALVTRGLAELSRLVEACGGNPETVSGLAGVGDVLLTTTGDASRNRQVGLQLASGKSLDEVLQSLGHVAEGVYAARHAHALANARGVEMPITRAVTALLRGDTTPQAAIHELLTRKPRTEF